MHKKDAAAEAYLEPFQKYMMEFFGKVVNGY